MDNNLGQQASHYKPISTVIIKQLMAEFLLKNL